MFIAKYRHDKFSETAVVQTSSVDVLLDNEMFGTYSHPYVVFPCTLDLQLNTVTHRHLVNVLTISNIPSAGMYNLGRTSKSKLAENRWGNGTALAPKNGAAGELVDVVQFGFIHTSTLIEGRTYKTSQGNRLLKECTFYPVSCEWERTKAVMSSVFNGKVCTVQVTEAGAISASTKHTAVDEDGNPEQKSEHRHVT